MRYKTRLGSSTKSSNQVKTVSETVPLIQVVESSTRLCDRIADGMPEKANSPSRERDQKKDAKA